MAYDLLTVFSRQEGPDFRPTLSHTLQKGCDLSTDFDTGGITTAQSGCKPSPRIQYQLPWMLRSQELETEFSIQLGPGNS